MTLNVIYYDAGMNRMDCASCGTNVQTLTNRRCALCVELSVPNCPLNTGRGVPISTDLGPAPRHGGLASLRTTSPHGGV